GGSDVETSNGQFGGAGAIGQTKGEEKPAEKTAIPRDAVARARPVGDRAGIILGKIGVAGFLADLRELGIFIAPGGDLFQLAAREGHWRAFFFEPFGAAFGRKYRASA